MRGAADPAKPKVAQPLILMLVIMDWFREQNHQIKWVVDFTMTKYQGQKKRKKKEKREGL